MSNKSIACAGLAFLLLSACGGAKTQSAVSVTGTGAVMAQPDMVVMRISCSYIAPTTKQAKDEVDKRITRLLAILGGEGVENNNIKTIALRYDEAREYDNGRSITLGQRARQTLLVTVKDIINNQARFLALLDTITGIDNVDIEDITFDLEQKTALFHQARELAYQKALDKARHYAALSGQSVEKALNISEERANGVRLTQSNIAYDSAGFYGASSALPSGEQEISAEITVTFLVK